MLTRIEDYLIIWSVAAVVAYITFIVFKKLNLFTDYSDTYIDFQQYVNDGVYTYEADNLSIGDGYGLSGLTATKCRELSSEMVIEEITDEEDVDYSTVKLLTSNVPLIEEPIDEEYSTNGNDCGMTSNATQQVGETGNTNYYDNFGDEISTRLSVNVEEISPSNETATCKTVNKHNGSGTMSDDIQCVDESGEVKNDDEFSNDITEVQPINGEEISGSNETATCKTFNEHNGSGTMSDDIQCVDESGEVKNDDEFSNDITEMQPINGEEISGSNETATCKTVNEHNGSGTMSDDIQCVDESVEVKNDDEFSNDIIEVQRINGEEISRSAEIAIGRTINAYNDCKTWDANQHANESRQGNDNRKFSNDISKRQSVNVEDFSVLVETAIGKEYNDCTTMTSSIQYEDTIVKMKDESRLGNASDVINVDFLRSDHQDANVCNSCNITPDIFQHNDKFRNNITDVLKSNETPVDSMTDVYGGSNRGSKKPMTKKMKRFNKSFRKLFCARCVKGVKD